MRKYLIDRNIGFDFKKGKSKIPRLKKDKLIKCYIGSKMTNNYGDISLINPNELPNFDLFNFSFPCTNISVAGKQEGMKKADGSITSSGLYIYGINIIKEKKPKYIMIENVKNLISKKFIGDFNKIINELNDIGYNCYYPTKEDKKDNQKPICLNAKNYGIPQNRERIFVICVRKDVDNSNFKFWEGKDFGIRLKDILEDKVDEKYYLSQEIQDRFKLNGVKDKEHNELNVVGSSAPDFRSIGQRDMTYGTNGIMSTLTATDYKQPKQIIDTNKLSRDGKTVCEFRNDEGIRYFKDNICGTIRTIDSGGDKRIIEKSKFKKMENPYDIVNEHFQNNEFIEPMALDEQNKRIRKDFTVGTLTTDGSSPKKNNRVIVKDVDECRIDGFVPLTSKDTHRMVVKGNTVPSGHTAGRIFDIEGISSTVMYRNSKVVQIAEKMFPNNKKQVKINGEIYYNPQNEYYKEVKSDKYLGYIGNQPKQATKVYDIESESTTLTANGGGQGGKTGLYHLGYAIRKLTPLECWRLMGFDDEDFQKAQSQGISDSQLYKQAGNSIVVNCLYYIFKNLFKDYIIQ